MALLSTCWLIIEYVLIPDGFSKWFCLSIFIHPVFLFFCQIFLWAKSLAYWISAVLFYPLRGLWFVILWVFTFLRNHVICIFSSAGTTSFETSQEFTSCGVTEIHHPVQSIVLYNCHRVSRILKERVVFEETDYIKELVTTNDSDHSGEPEVHEEMDLDEDSSSSSSSLRDEDLSSGSESPLLEREADAQREDKETDPFYEKETDPFYEKYVQRMRWFDLLNYERTCGIGAVLINNQLESPSLETIEPTDLFLPYITRSKMSERKLLKSLESDFEMVYVGQTCLCWEALHHQYTKVEALVHSSAQKGIFHGNVAGDFQKFQVLLERFMEDERTKGKRYWNYVQGRFSLKSLLQVPELSGYLEEDKEGLKGRSTRVREVLKAIEKSISAFWDFVQTDNKESWWRLRKYLWTFSPLEDPKDLKLLAELKNGLQRLKLNPFEKLMASLTDLKLTLCLKKQLWMKDLQGKKKCWLKRENYIQESQRREILYSMIEMKLVSRVLKMSIISTPQLKWCQEKLASIEFKEGRVIRTCSDFLFPT